MEIPSYPVARPLTLEDKDTLDRLFRQIEPRISEFTFANIYLFRKAHDYRLSKIDYTIVILGRGYGGQGYFLLPPAGEFDLKLQVLLDDGLTMYGAEKSLVERYLQREDLEIKTDRDNFDYLYSREELAELQGNRFHKKKNRVNYFSSRHDCRIEIFDERHLEGCLELLEIWERVHREMDGGGSGAFEVEANGEALRMAQDLGIKGVVALVEGKVKAFALGERLNSDTSLCHFEKADPFLEGLYQLIDREFNRLLFTDCKYVNREQDLGLVNLRRSKLSYHPVELVEKYLIRKK
jgi:hypothetical protein